MGEIADIANIDITSSSTKSSSSSSSIFLQIIEHPDGSVSRPVIPLSPPSDAESNPKVLSKDIPLDSEKNTWLRLYLPNPPPKDTKLPILLYFHGGGFVIFSPDFLLYHVFCEKTAAALPAIVVSLHYRLSPEHRLPAAYDDAIDALLWLTNYSTTEPWIASHGDISRCFLAGSSSGGNMAYHAGLRASKMSLLEPARLSGLVMIQPYLGGETRTVSEEESAEDEVLPLRANDMMWRLALPVGADRDHEYCNPVGKGAVLPRCLVAGCKGDPLFDRQREFVRMLEAEGVDVAKKFDDEGYHAIEIFEPGSAEALLAEVREFVNGA